MSIRKKIALTISFALICPYVITVFFHGTWARENEVTPPGPNIIIESAQGTEAIPIEKYMEGVLAPYLVQNYNDEELKAISIVLRTNLVLDLEREVKPQIEYLSYREQRQLFMEQYDINRKRMTDILTETCGQILLYQGKVVEVPFFKFRNETDSYTTILNNTYEFYTIYQSW